MICLLVIGSAVFDAQCVLDTPMVMWRSSYRGLVFLFLLFVLAKRPQEFWQMHGQLEYELILFCSSRAGFVSDGGIVI